ncbi:MAG: TraR/DksA family transcriptional regulator [Candidatus Saccharibacteria bacterium]|nr:TraR/DksA family transcriptional regulator [Pseudorhodobacter sp.]
MTPITTRQTQLEQRLADLTTRLGEIKADLNDTETQDWDDLAKDREDDEMLEKLGLDSQTEVRATNAALQRIKDGSYGVCVRCGAQIEAARLDLLPFTPFCKDHAT